MEEIIQAVTCPFTGTTNLSVPTEGIWAGRIDDGEYVVFYFDAEDVFDEGLDSCLSELMEDQHMDKVGKAREVLQNTEQIKVVKDAEGDEWYFVRLPKLPYQPTVADLILENQ
jgi:hypothetical protein